MKKKYLSIGALILLISACTPSTSFSSDDIISDSSTNNNSEVISSNDNTSNSGSEEVSSDEPSYVTSSVTFTSSTDLGSLVCSNINVTSFSSSGVFTDANNALRMGSGKQLGVVTIGFDSLLVNSIYVYGSVYGNDEYSDLKLTAGNYSKEQQFTSDYLVFNLTSDTNITSLTLETITTKKRFNLSKIVFNGKSGGDSSKSEPTTDSSTTGDSSSSGNSSTNIDHGDYKYLYNNTIPNSRGKLGSVDSYYESCRGLKGTALKNELNSIINKNKKTFGYDHLKESFKVTDVDPYDTSNLILCYTSEKYSISSFSSAGWNYINREHVWPNSKGVGTSGPGADKHMQHPCEQKINSLRGSLDFGTVKGTSDAKDMSEYGSQNVGNYRNSSYFEPKDSWKGDVARTIFYMATCYSSLEVSGSNIDKNSFNYYTSTYGLGNFNDLYSWATSGIDPVDDFEVNRNNLIDEKYQNNRNPFVDHPEFIIMIYDKNYSGEGALNDL